DVRQPRNTGAPMLSPSNKCEGSSERLTALLLADHPASNLAFSLNLHLQYP
ncbi:hypothetical protein Nepgr_028991, partial [Nepenthes gracilis]